MISDFIIALNRFDVPMNFICHLLVFIGAFYIALHNRNLPQWLITPLWYLGLMHFFTGLTAIIQWTIGPEHPLSYWNMGLFGEVMCNVALSSIVLIMFFVTVREDFIGIKNRRKS